MTRDMSEYFRMRHAVPNPADRRKRPSPLGIPLVGSLGLLAIDRRYRGERRKYHRLLQKTPPCALLRWHEQSHSPLFSRRISLRWRGLGHRSDSGQEIPWLLRWQQPSSSGPLMRIGAWFRERLGRRRSH